VKPLRYLVTILLALPLWSGVQNLSLDQAIEMLKKENLELKISRFDEQIKQYEAKIARAYKLGKLDTTVTGMRSNDAGNVFGFKLQSREATFGDFGFGELKDGADPLPVAPKALNYPVARNHYLAKATFAIPLYTGGKLEEYGKIAHKMVEMSRLDTKKVLQEKIFQTKKTFFDIALVEQYINHLTKINTNIKRLEGIVTAMQQEGYAIQTDILEVQSRSEEAQSMLIEAQLNRDLAYQFLSFLLNQEVHSIVKPKEIKRYSPLTPENIQQNNLDIQKAKLGVEISRMAVAVQESNFLPNIGAFAEYGSGKDAFLQDFRDKDFYTAGVQLSWNIFNGGIDSANLQKAKIEFLKTTNQLELAKSGIAVQAKKLQTEIFAHQKKIAAHEKKLQLASKVYETYSEKYKEGIASISDVLVKQSEELQALLELLGIKNDYHAKIFALENLANKGVE